MPDVAHDHRKLLACSFVRNVAADLHTGAFNLDGDVARKAEPFDLLADGLRPRVGVGVRLENLLTLVALEKIEKRHVSSSDWPASV